MASKAYVVAMTVSELRDELKQRGMSAKGSKKDLRDRLEQALDDEELDDPSSGSEGGGDMYSLGFNFEVPPESFIAEEDLLPDADDEEEDEECEPMIVSVELSNRDSLKVCPRASASTKMGVGVRGRTIDDRSLNPMVPPMVVEMDMLGQRQGQAVNAFNNNDKNSRYISSSNQINSSMSTTNVATTTGQSRNKVELATSGKLLEMLAGGQDGNMKPGTKKVEIHHIPREERTEVRNANSVSEKKDTVKKEQVVVVPSVHGAAAVGGELHGTKKTKRASAAAAVSKIKASMEDASDKTSLPATTAAAQPQQLSPADKKKIVVPETVLKGAIDVKDMAKPVRDTDKRKASGVIAAKSRGIQKSSGQETSKEQVPVKVEEPVATTVGKRESRRRVSEKMEVDPSPTAATTTATTTKPKESVATGRKAKQAKDSTTTTTSSSPKNTPPEQSNLFPDYRSCPPQRAAAVAALRNAALAQRSSSPRASSQKNSTPMQKNTSPTQKAAAQKSGGSPKSSVPLQKSPVSGQKGSAAAQKSGTAQKPSSPAQKQASQKSASPPVKSAPAKKPLPAQKGSASKKPIPSQKGTAQKLEVAQKTSDSPTSNPVPERRSLTSQKKSSPTEKIPAASDKESAQKITNVAANSISEQNSSTPSQVVTTGASKRKRASSPPKPASKNSPLPKTISPQDKVPPQKSLASTPEDSTSVPEPAKKKKTSPPAEGRAAARKASLAQKREQVHAGKRTVTLKLKPVHVAPESPVKTSETGKKLNDAVKKLTLDEGSDQKKNISSDANKAVQEVLKDSESVKEEKKIEQLKKKQSPSVAAPPSLKNSKAAVSRRTSIANDSNTQSKMSINTNEEVSGMSASDKDIKKEVSTQPQDKAHSEAAETSGILPASVMVASAEVVSSTDVASRGETEVKTKKIDLEHASEDRERDVDMPDAGSTDSSQEEHQKLPPEPSLASGVEESSMATDHLEHEKKPRKVPEKNLLGELSMDVEKSETVCASDAKASEVEEGMVTTSIHDAKELPQAMEEEKMEVDTLKESSVELTGVEAATSICDVSTSNDAERKGLGGASAQPIAMDADVSRSNKKVEDAQDSDDTPLEKEEEPMEVVEENDSEDVTVAVSIAEGVNEFGKGSEVCEVTGGKEKDKEIKHMDMRAEGQQPVPVDVEGEKSETQQPTNQETVAESKGKFSSGSEAGKQTQHSDREAVVETKEVDSQGALPAPDSKLKAATGLNQEESGSESRLCEQVESEAQNKVADEYEGMISLAEGRSQVCSSEESDQNRRTEIESGKESHLLEKNVAKQVPADNISVTQDKAESKEGDKIGAFDQGEEEEMGHQKIEEKDNVQEVQQKDLDHQGHESAMPISEEHTSSNAALVQSSEDERKLDLEEKREVTRGIALETEARASVVAEKESVQQSVLKEDKSPVTTAAENVISMEIDTDKQTNIGADEVPQGASEEAPGEMPKKDMDVGILDNKGMEVNKESDEKMQEKPVMKEDIKVILVTEDQIVKNILPTSDASADTNASETTAIPETNVTQAPDVNTGEEDTKISEEDSKDADRDEKTLEPMELSELAQPSTVLSNTPERPTSIVSSSSDNHHLKLTSSPCSTSEPLLVEPEQAATHPIYRYAAEHKSSGFLSPRRSPAPSSSLVDEDHGLVTSALLYSPAPSLDDTSSMRVEPPSPRSEISNMELPSFSEMTPMDGQASAMELSGFDLDDPSGSEPHHEPVVERESSYESGAVLEQEQEGDMPRIGSSLTSSQLKELAMEEKLGSEVSSEISSLPPLGTDDDVSESGVSMGDVPVGKESGNTPESQHDRASSERDPLPVTHESVELQVSCVANVTIPVDTMKMKGMETEQDKGMEEEAQKATVEQDPLSAELGEREKLVNPLSEAAVTSAAEKVGEVTDEESTIPVGLAASGVTSLDNLPKNISASDDRISTPVADSSNDVLSTLREEQSAITISTESSLSVPAAPDDQLQDQVEPEDMDLDSDQDVEELTSAHTEDSKRTENAGHLVGSEMVKDTSPSGPATADEQLQEQLEPQDMDLGSEPDETRQREREEELISEETAGTRADDSKRIEDAGLPVGGESIAVCPQQNRIEEPPLKMDEKSETQDDSDQDDSKVQKDDTKEENVVVVAEISEDKAAETLAEVSSTVSAAETVSSAGEDKQDGRTILGGLQSLQAAYDDDESSNASSTEQFPDDKERRSSTDEVVRSAAGESSELRRGDKMSDCGHLVRPDTEVSLASERNIQSEVGVVTERELHISQEVASEKSSQMIEEDVTVSEVQDISGSNVEEKSAEENVIESSEDDGLKEELKTGRENQKESVDQGVVDMDVDDGEEDIAREDGDVPEGVISEAESTIGVTHLPSEKKEELGLALDQQQNQPVMLSSITEPPASGVCEAAEYTSTSSTPQEMVEEKSWDNANNTPNNDGSSMEVLESETGQTCDKDNVAQNEADARDLSLYGTEKLSELEGRDYHDGVESVEGVVAPERSSVSSEAERRLSVEESENVSCSNVENVMATDTQEDSVTDTISKDCIAVPSSVEEEAGDQLAEDLEAPKQESESLRGGTHNALELGAESDGGGAQDVSEQELGSGAHNAPEMGLELCGGGAQDASKQGCHDSEDLKMVGKNQNLDNLEKSTVEDTMDVDTHSHSTVDQDTPDESNLEQLTQDQDILEVNTLDRDISDQDQGVPDKGQGDQGVPDKGQGVLDLNRDIPDHDENIPDQVIPDQDQDITNQDQDIPSQDQDIPSQDQDIPSQDQDIPSQDQDIPSQDQDIPSQDQDIPSQDQDIPSQDQDIPSQDQNIPSQDQDIPSQDQDIPSQDQDIPSQDQDIPSQDQGIPSQDQDIPSRDQNLNQDFPDQDQSIPGLGQDVSDPVQDIPDQNLNPLDHGSPDESVLQQDTLDETIPEQISLNQDNFNTLDQDTDEPGTTAHQESSHSDISQHNTQSQDWHNQDEHLRETSTNHSTQNQSAIIQDIHIQKQETEEHDTTHASNKQNFGIQKLSQDQDMQTLDNQNQDFQKLDNQNQDMQTLDNQDQDIQKLENRNQDIQNQNNHDHEVQNMQNPDSEDQDIQNLDNQDQDIRNLDNQDQDIQNLDNQDQDIQNLDNQDQDIQNLDNQDQKPKHSDNEAQKVLNADSEKQDSQCSESQQAKCLDIKTEQAVEVSSVVEASGNVDVDVASSTATAILKDKSTESARQDSEYNDDPHSMGPVDSEAVSADDSDAVPLEPSETDMDDEVLEHIPASSERIPEPEGVACPHSGDDEPDTGFSTGHITEDPDQDIDDALSVKKIRLSVEDAEAGGAPCVGSETIEASEVDEGALSEKEDSGNGEEKVNLDYQVRTSLSENEEEDCESSQEISLAASKDCSKSAASGTGSELPEVEDLVMKEQECSGNGCSDQGGVGVARSGGQDPRLSESEQVDIELTGHDEHEQEGSTGHAQEEHKLSNASDQNLQTGSCADGRSSCEASECSNDGGVSQCQHGGVSECQQESEVSGPATAELNSSECDQEDKESSGCGQESSGCGQDRAESSTQLENDVIVLCAKSGSRADDGHEESARIRGCGLTEVGSPTELREPENYSHKTTEEETFSKNAEDRKETCHQPVESKEEIVDKRVEKGPFHDQTEGEEETTNKTAESKSSYSVSSAIEDRVAASDALTQLINDSSSQDSTLEASVQLLKRPSASEGQVSVGSHPLNDVVGGHLEDGATSDPSQVEMDLMLHAEPDDLSVFSSEVAEADHLVALGGKGRLAITGVKRRSSSSGHSSSAPAEGRLASKKRRTSRDSPGRGGSPYAAGSSRGSPVESSSKDCKRPRETTPDPVTLKRRRLSGGLPQYGSHDDASGTTATGAEQRKRRWGRKKDSSDSVTTPTISTDVLKDIIPPGLEPLEGLELSLADTEQEQLTGHVTSHVTGSESAQLTSGDQLTDDGVTITTSPDNDIATMGDRERNSSSSSRKDSEEPVFSPEDGRLQEGGAKPDKELKAGEADQLQQEMETRRRIEARLREKQEVEKERRKSLDKLRVRSHSPPPRRPSKLLHVNYLTRPYSRVQLFELLSEDAPFVQEHFWTDHIKSNCIALYESVNAAVAARTRIHGIKWPSTNPKRLSVDFLSIEDAVRLSSGQLALPPDLEVEDKDYDGGVAGDVVKDAQEKEGDGVSNGEPISASTKQEKVSSPVTSSGKSHRRSRDSKSSMKEGEEEEGMEESPAESPVKKEPTRMLDELFKKTTSTPSIYWLPLTEDEVTERQKKAEEEEAARVKRKEDRVKAREEERKKRQQDRKDRHEKAAEEDRERRSKAKLRRRRSHSNSRSRSRSRDRDHKRRRK